MSALRRGLLIFAVVWLLALAASTAFRLWRGTGYPPARDQQSSQVAVDPALLKHGETVELAYRELGGEGAGGVPVLLLHGNPVAGRAMLPLAKAMEPRRRLIPDLPGLGASSRNLKTYSAINQATVLLEWLEAMEVDRVHLVAYSQSGPLALEMANRAPERVESVSLIAAVGLQEYELLRRYDFNQPLYAVYRAGLWALRWLTPHFGALDRSVFDPNTARNFADTDLRRSRAGFLQLTQPALILHSPDDALVPFSAAQAHAELLPQARIQTMPGGHLGIIRESGAYAEAVDDFLRSVEAGSVEGRARAGFERGAELPGGRQSARQGPSLAQNLLIGGLLFLLVFVSEDLACIAGGILAAGGSLSLGAAIGGCLLGIWVSDLLLYAIGSVFGFRALRFKWFRRATGSARFGRFRDAYAANGLKVVFYTRFLPGSRVIAYLTAGALRIGWFRFALWLGLAVTLWTPFLVGTAYWVGQPLVHWWERHGLWVLPLLLLAVAALHLGLRVATLCLTWRGRRRLLGAWIRLVRWEFWPAFPLYLPVFLYGIRLAWKHRSATVWAACNPGMHPAGGLALESKSEILSQLAPGSDSASVARWAHIATADSAVERLEAVVRFQRTLDPVWPLVLKPDIGQRGEGVAVLRSEAELLSYLERYSEPVIAQAYAPGEEYGVFYLRHPGESTGRLLSITHKVLPELTGDGIHTLEWLILRDPRAVAMAPHYFKTNARRLDWVPGEGERVRLVELGTHCRGAIFLDANAHRTEALRAALDEVVAAYEGFSFGRFDLRAPSVEDLRAGRKLKILELNGVSSESTDIYDPANSLPHAWRVLCRQWRLAFEIGAAWRARGAAVPTVREIFKILRAHRARKPFEVHAGSGSDLSLAPGTER